MCGREIAMGKTLYLHLGGPKTGTTALQAFCANNSEALLDQHAFCYPETGRDMYMTHRSLFKERKPELWHELRNEIQGKNAKTVMLSWERHLFDIGDIVNEGGIEAIRSVFPDFAVKVIYYIRRQDDLMKSRYNQITKPKCPPHAYDRRLLRSWKDFLGFSLSVNWDIVDYCGSVREICGSENVIFRLYDRDFLKNGDMLDDCFSIFDIAIDGLSRKYGRANPRLPDAVVPWLSHLTAIGRHDPVESNVFKNKLIQAFDNRGFDSIRKKTEKIITSNIDAMDEIVPGYKKSFEKRACSMALPHEPSPKDLFFMDVLFELYRDVKELRAATMKRDETLTQVTGNGDPLVEYNRDALERTASGKWCFVKPEGNPKSPRIFATSVEMAERFLVSKIFTALGFQDCEVIAQKEFFLDHRYRHPLCEICSLDLKAIVLPYAAQCELVLPGQFLFGVVGMESMRSIAGDKSTMLALRDLRHAVVSYAYQKASQEHMREANDLTSRDILDFMSSGMMWNVRNRMLEFAGNLDSLHVVRFEELISPDERRAVDSVNAIASASGCGSEEAFAALKTVREDPWVKRYVFRTEELFSLWNDELEERFVKMGLDKLNRELGYSSSRR